MNASRRQIALWTGVGLAWSGYAVLQYRTAAARAYYECQDELYGGQRDICVRNAMEQRDNVLLWGLGVPLGLVIIAAIARHVRIRP